MRDNNNINKIYRIRLSAKEICTAFACAQAFFSCQDTKPTMKREKCFAQKRLRR